jgi:hypothetical protein
LIGKDDVLIVESGELEADSSVIGFKEFVESASGESDEVGHGVEISFVEGPAKPVGTIYAQESGSIIALATAHMLEQGFQLGQADRPVTPI